VGVVVVVASIVIAVALIASKSQRTAIAASVGGAFTAAYGLFLALFDGHPSGLLVAIAALAITVLGPISARRTRAPEAPR
jgi:hypothetical protein